GQNLKLHQALAAVPQSGADTVRARVAAADDDHVLILGGDVLAVDVVAVEQALGVGVQELHSIVDALEVAAFDGQVTPLRGAAAKDEGVKLRLQIGDCRLQIGRHSLNPKS